MSYSAQEYAKRSGNRKAMQASHSTPKSLINAHTPYTAIHGCLNNGSFTYIERSPQNTGKRNVFITHGKPPRFEHLRCAKPIAPFSHQFTHNFTRNDNLVIELP